MTHLVAIILGFVEGATEFIPVSSSGHLLIARQILGVNNDGGLTFDAILQLSTSCALLVYFWKDILKIIVIFFRVLSRKNTTATNSKQDEVMFWTIVLGTIPAVVFGLLLEKQMETIFRNIHLVAFTLLLGSLLMWWAQKVAKENKILSIKRGVVIGFYQCLALIPGVSRSGATISGGLLSGLTKDDAVRFSFLLSMPIIFGSGLKKVFEVRHDIFSTGFGNALLLGSIVSFVVGLISINLLINYLKKHDLNMFIFYRIALSIAIFLMF